jgi:uncharacterized protein HemY
MTATFPARIAAARTAVTQTHAALATALQHVQPPTPDLHKLFLDRPESYAKALRQMADILDSLPALRDAAAAADEALKPLEEQACWKCHGTGEYAGATNARRRGVPYCFDCDGHGTRP